MVGYAPALLALTLNLDGFHIFKETKPTINNNPSFSCMIFMVAVLVILTHVEIYPPYFRKLWWCGNMFFQFLCSQMTFEYLLADFWFPVEDSLTCIVNLTIEYLDQLDATEPIKSILEALKCENTAIVSSYLLSGFFLLAALHATKLIDLRILDCGLNPFMQDIYKRCDDFMKSLIQSVTESKNYGRNKKPKAKCGDCPKNLRKKACNDTDDDSSGKWEPPKKFCKRGY